MLISLKVLQELLKSCIQSAPAALAQSGTVITLPAERQKTRDSR